jgi:indolepyruvate ferredoxin oxidoreductase
VGFAFQRGLIPLSRESLEQAIRLNGVAVEFNLQAFGWGRLTAHDRTRAESIARPILSGAEEVPDQTLDELVERRVAFLTEYQDAAYAKRYEDFVSRVRVAERERVRGADELSETVARNLFKLMAYKDEYEVARLYTDGTFREKLERQFEGGYRLRFHLAPPLLARRDPATGHLRKREYGPWVLKAFGVLAALKGLRGGPFDIFGRSEERRTERESIERYRDTVARLLDRLGPENHAEAVEIARIPDMIRGFGHVKMRNVSLAAKREAELLAHYESAPESGVTQAAHAAAGD